MMADRKEDRDDNYPDIVPEDTRTDFMLETALEKRMGAVEDALRPSRGSLPKKS